MELKICKWDKTEFKPAHGNEEYCSDQCKLEAKREKDRLRQQKYYQKNKKQELGTFKLSKFTLKDASTATYLGILIASEAWTREYEEIHKLHEKIGVRVYSKGKEFENLTSYKGITREQFDTFNIIFPLENCAPCPLCQAEEQDKDLKHAETICRNPECEGHGGLIIRGPVTGNYPPGQAKMAITAKDISIAQRMQRKGIDMSPQDVAWNDFNKKL